VTKIADKLCAVLDQQPWKCSIQKNLLNTYYGRYNWISFM